jgi:hypothetical protein
MRLSPLAIAATLLLAPSAFADDATVSVGHDFARPPRPPERVIIVEDPPPPPHDYVVNTDPLPHEIYRSPFRLGVGPYGVTTGRGLGLGMGVHADIGTGTVGVRVAAAWLRGEPQGDTLVMPATGTSMGQYTAEVVLDMHKNGPFHPLLGLGVGLLHIAKNDVSGDAAIGVARLGIEYSLGLDDADVRLGVSIMGAMPGAADRELSDLRAYGMLNSTITIGF